MQCASPIIPNGIMHVFPKSMYCVCVFWIQAESKVFPDSIVIPNSN